MTTAWDCGRAWSGRAVAACAAVYARTIQVLALRGERGRLTPSRVRELIAGLAAESDALLRFTASIEEDFIALGAMLRNISSLARDIQTRSDEVIAAASGQSEGAAIQFAFQLLKKAEDVVRGSRDQYSAIFAVFGKMDADLGRIERDRQALERTLAPLESSNAQFRIQACAFDETTRERFFALADEIRAIVADVRTAVARRFEELERTGQTTREVVTRLRAMADDQERATGKMLAETRQRLTEINQALLTSEAAAQSMSQSGLRIAGGVNAAIMALQCQDMARQKFEHTAAAVREMNEHLAAGASAPFTANEDHDCRRFLAGAGRVQERQLEAVFNQLDDAADRARQGMVEVKCEADAFAERAMNSGAAALDSHMMQQAAGSIRGVLAIIETAVSSLSGVVGIVEKLESTFTDCTSHILDLAVRLRVVALNAQIFAAHVDKGAALEVVARNTRTTTDEAMEQLQEISTRVAELVASVVELRQTLRDYGELAATEQPQLQAEAAESENGLKAVEVNLRAALDSIPALQRDLSRSVRQATDSIRFPDAVGQARSRSVAFFAHIAAMDAGLDGDGERATHFEVEQLRRNYTMAHEREVHQAAMGSGVAVAVEENGRFAAGHAAGPANDIEKENLADNVELF